MDRIIWTSEKDADLVRLRSVEHKTWLQIGIELGSSKTAVQRRYAATIPIEEQINLGKGSRRKWTEEDEAEVWRLRHDEKKKYTEIAFIFGMTTGQVAAKLERMRVPTRRVHFERETVRFTVPQKCLEDRDRRYRLEPRDLTASLCGDPLVGYSALERLP